MKQRNAAFTLVELLVVIGIIAVLISILLPALNKARASAQAVACSSNMRQLVNACILYATEHNGLFPSNDARLPNPNNPAVNMNWNWWTKPLVGKYLNDTSDNPNYVRLRVYFCPAMRQTASSAPNGMWGNDFGIGYNCYPGNKLYMKYPSVEPSDPAYAGQVASTGAYNLTIAKQGRFVTPEKVLIFTDVSAGLTSPYEGANRFIQIYNASYPAFAANPPNEAVVYRHYRRANVAFADGHVASFGVRKPQDRLANTNKDDGLHAAMLAGELTYMAR